MTRLGRVIATEGDRAQVSTVASSFCGSCTAKGACHLVAPGEQAPKVVLAARNAIGARPGETVELELAPGTHARLSLLVWILPLAGILGGAVAGATLGAPDGTARDARTLVGAAVGFAAALGALRLVDRRAAGDSRLLPRIVRVVPAGAACAPLREDG